MKNNPLFFSLLRIRIAVLLALAAACFAPMSSWAAEPSWKNNAASTAWGTGSNWVSGTAPVSSTTTDTALFNQTSYSNQPNYGTTSIAGITVGDGTTNTAALTLTGTTLTLGTSGITINPNSGTVGLSNAVRLAGNQTWTNNSSSLFTVGATITNDSSASPVALTIAGTGNTTMSGIISDNTATGQTSLSKNGTGTLTLTGSSTYKGATTVNAGTLVLNSAADSQTGMIQSSSLIVNTNATVRITGAGSTPFGYSGGVNTVNFVINEGSLISDATGRTNFYAGTGAGNTGNMTLNGGLLQSNGGVSSSSTSKQFDWGNFAVNVLSNAKTSEISGRLNIRADSGNNIVGFNVASGATNGTDLLVSAAITESALSGITKTGAGTLVLSGANTYTGNTTITAGTLRIGNNSALGTGQVVFNGGALSASDSVTARTLANNMLFSSNATIGDSVNSAALAFSGNGDLGATTRTLTINSAVTFSGQIFNGGLTKAGTGNLTLSNIGNYYTGNTTVNEGRLIMTGGLGSSGNFSIASGGVLEVTNSSTLTPITAGRFSGAGTFQKTGAGNLRFASNGPTVAMSAGSVFDVQGGMIELSTANWSSNNLSSLNVASGARFAAVNVNVFVDALTGAGQIDSGLNNNEIFTFGVNNGSGTFTGNLTDTTAGVYRGAFTKAGTGTQILTGNNTYTRGTTISGGTLQLGDGGSTGSLSTSSAIVNNGTLSINRSNSVTQGTDFSGAAITGTGSFIQAGTGTTTLNAANTYSGTTTVSAGTLIATNANALGASTGNITASGGTLNLGGNSFLRTGLVRFSGGTVSNGTITNNTTAFDAQSGNISAILAGSAGLTKSSNGTLSLSGINTYSGTTTVSAGTLIASNANALGASTGNITASGGTLDLGGNSFLRTGLVRFSGGTVSNGTITNNTTAFDAQSGNISAILAGSAGLTKSGNGTLSLSGINTYTGATTISSGTLQLGDGNATGSLSASSAITNNGTLSINRSNAVTQGTDFSSAAITGTGSFIQAGSGTTTLNAANTYTGTTTVSAGTLALGSGGSIANGSVLTISAGAIFDVTAKSSFTLNNPLTIEVGATNAGSLNAAGISLTYGNNLTLNITTSTPLSTYNLFGFGSETGTFASVSLSGAYSGALTGSGDVWSLTSDGNIWTFTESTGVLAVSAVPEPGTWALVGVSLSALLLFRRRKNEVG